MNKYNLTMKDNVLEGRASDIAWMLRDLIYDILANSIDDYETVGIYDCLDLWMMMLKFIRGDNPRIAVVIDETVFPDEYEIYNLNAIEL